MTPNGRFPSKHLLASISASRDNGEFTDLTLSHGMGLFKVHRIIVCPQSKVIHKACTGKFKESFTGVIEMADVSYVEVEKLVNFFYSMSYSDEVSEEAGQEMDPPISSLQLHVRMFALGDRYDIPGLRDVAAKKYLSRCEVSGISLELLESIYDVYRRTPSSIRQLRDAAANTIRKKLPTMLDDKDVAAAYENLLTEVPEFTRDLLGIYVKAPLYRYCRDCNSDQGMEALQVRCMGCGKGR